MQLSTPDVYGIDQVMVGQFREPRVGTGGRPLIRRGGILGHSSWPSAALTSLRERSTGLPEAAATLSR